MKNSKTLTIAAAALSGMLVGSAARAASFPTASGSSSRVTSSAGQRATPLDAAPAHDCKGQNACKGQGGCKSSDKGCKGLNSCKGNGGCKTNAATTAPGL